MPAGHVDLVGELAGEADRGTRGAATPATARLAQGHEREALGVERRGPGASVASRSRERGPTTATVAHCSVTDVQCTRSSGHSVCSHSSSQSSTAAALPVVVVIRIAVVRQADHDAVVEDHAVGACT